MPGRPRAARPLSAPIVITTIWIFHSHPVIPTLPALLLTVYSRPRLPVCVTIPRHQRPDAPPPDEDPPPKDEDEVEVLIRAIR